MDRSSGILQRNRLREKAWKQLGKQGEKKTKKHKQQLNRQRHTKMTAPMYRDIKTRHANSCDLLWTEHCIQTRCCYTCWWWLFPWVRGFWENIQQLIPHLRSFYFYLRISSHTLFPFFRPGSIHSGWTSWSDCGWVFPEELQVSSFPDRFPRYAWTAA